MPWLENVRGEPLAPFAVTGSSSIAKMTMTLLSFTILIRRRRLHKSRLWLA